MTAPDRVGSMRLATISAMIASISRRAEALSASGVRIARSPNRPGASFPRLPVPDHAPPNRIASGYDEYDAIVIET